MGLPAKQRTRTSKKQRGSHFALKKKITTKCEKCGTLITPHQACPQCGTYKGRQVIDVAKRATRLKRSHKGTGKPE